MVLPMVHGELDVEVDHDDDVDGLHGVVAEPSSHLDSVSHDDDALDVVEGPSSCLDLVSLDVGAIDVVEGPSPLHDDGALDLVSLDIGANLDQPHLELCFLRRNGVKTLSLTFRSADFFFREACS